MERNELDTMVSGYLSAACFTADESLMHDREPGEFTGTLCHTRMMKRMGHNARAEAHTVCAQFYNANAKDLADYPADCAGHDLWYTRNRHGCGYWEADYCTKEQGERLTRNAHALGERSLISGRGGWLAFDLG